MELDPRNFTAWCLRADAQIRTNAFDSALATVDRGLRVDSTQSALWLRRAEACNTRWHWEQRAEYVECAASAFEHVILQDPGNRQAHLGLAEQYTKLGKLDEAYRVYEMMHTNWPADTAAWFRHAETYFGQNQPDKGRWVLDRAVEANPDDFGIRMGRFYDLCYLGTIDNPEQEREELLRRNSSPKAQEAIADALAAAREKAGYWREAVAEETRLLERNPTDHTIWYRRGMARRRAGQRLELQLADFDSSIAYCPIGYTRTMGEPEPWCGKAMVLNDMGRKSGALALLDSVIAQFPTYPGVWQLKGQFLFYSKQYAEALPCFDRAIGLDGRDMWSRYMKERTMTMLHAERKTP